jgi:hypothetical protein
MTDTMFGVAIMFCAGIAVGMMAVFMLDELFPKWRGRR